MPQLTHDRLEELLDRIPAVRVGVVGDVMLDVYLVGSVARISPEAPVPVVQVREERSAVGGAGNVAANVAALGASCVLVGCVGLDPAGSQVRRTLEGAIPGRVDARLIEHADRPTTTKTRVMARHQQIVRFDRETEDDLPDGCVGELRRLAAALGGECDVLVLQDYNKGVLGPPVIDAALAGARQAGVPVVVDPKFSHFFAFAGATIFKPNALELTSALGETLRVDDDVWLQGVRGRVGARHLLLTLGEHGMVLASEEDGVERFPAMARDVYDVSGAGDTVTAFLAMAIGAGATVREGAQLANLAAGVEVGKAGVATVAPAELREALTAQMGATYERR
jgi:D-glycero-beta-D-manno-heptose-7-phosphate kinase